MRTLFFSCYLSIASICLGADNQITGIANLLGALPRQEVLKRSQDIVKNKVQASEEEMKEANKAVAKAKEIVPQLRKLIVAGRTVFDYPGLLGRGAITWNSPDYDLYLGVYLRSDQGCEPYDMRITFDQKGKILTVEDVRWKN